MPREMQAFKIAILDEEGVLHLHPMKAWLRDHPEHILEDAHPDTTNSRRVARALIRAGWAPDETEDEFRLFLPDARRVDGSSPSDDPETTSFFELEAQLRDFLAHNLQALRVGGKTLRLYVNQSQRRGVEYPTATGPIDILALDQDGAFVVFELKRAATPDSATGQLARYMGWVKATLAGGQAVHGVIVAKQITDRLRYAVQVMPNVSLFEYKVRFDLTPAT